MKQNTVTQAVKRVLAVVLAVVLVCLAPAVSAKAGGLLIATRQEGVEVYVTISDGNGTLCLTQEKVFVIDVDEDGAITVNDALYCAHEAAFEGGAEAGYGSAASDFGLSLTKLWGVENGGSYGYYINHASAMSLVDPVAEGDYLDAFCYTDLTTWSDQYVYFNEYTVTAKEGETVDLVLYGAGYDENWNPVVNPVVGAELTLNGEKTGVITDAEGKASLTLTAAGIISAVSESATLVPPTCVVVATDEVPQTGDTGVNMAAVLLCVAALLVLGAGFVKRTKTVYE